ncbi:MAG: hypothetical protein KME60_03260 [Cyanomargarita calcarea GSE-NOS-MK-12-04C]|jgi:hypothetical protein|uniref:Uncharacterized protein n=1 Tax=Cyanomargarita calcarea GSE-NOS-MK-12-04C TaxID=2839659 RepID=A0A951QHM9_9CYAN|nr:hypothetical protein [Cyanomargarita calcarea GSE-NOS-MK-12-04C]
MQIKLLHRVTNEYYTINTDNGFADDATINPDYLGDRVEYLTRELETSYGYYGHTINPIETTNIDLAVAVRSLPSFEVLSIDPEPTPSKLPEGSVS